MVQRTKSAMLAPIRNKRLFVFAGAADNGVQAHIANHAYLREKLRVRQALAASCTF